MEYSTISIEQFNTLKKSPNEILPQSDTDCIFWIKNNHIPKFGHREHSNKIWWENTGQILYLNEKSWPDDDIVCYIPLPKRFEEQLMNCFIKTTICLPHDCTVIERNRCLSILEGFEKEIWSENNPGYPIRIDVDIIPSSNTHRCAGITGINALKPESMLILKRINKEVFNFSNEDISQ